MEVKMFVSKITNAVSVGEFTVVIRKLSARQLEKCQEKAQERLFAMFRNAGGETLRALRDTQAKDVPDATKNAARYAGYDRWTTLQEGVVSWDAEMKLAEGLEALDEEASDQIFHAIVDLAKPNVKEVQGKD